MRQGCDGMVMGDSGGIVIAKALKNGMAPRHVVLWVWRSIVCDKAIKDQINVQRDRGVNIGGKGEGDVMGASSGMLPWKRGRWRGTGMDRVIAT